MTKRKIDDWKRLGVGIAASALTLAGVRHRSDRRGVGPHSSKEPDSQQNRGLRTSSLS